ncbi:class 1 fructose-bisphosphatase [Amorphoplanes digitatis]|uniref:Fructose-1,6-bisphosphatase class 1 n=1 Tax=Actinoplanes digitatis TaxID=1868 RepID=A0A7W7MRA7_9ACTN|nr:class 1 fructose-bisphosphatase [Actinoplanes digitatis]MBB4764046.1 fructose-1,6-bisphosphatase [Actinoplanes digitatis]GID93866.1 fructose-1,6-bisphosphatase class 1 [Actinoplanes digitatis]
MPNLTETAAGLVAPRGRITLTRHTIEQEHRHLDSTGDFSGLLNAIATAVKIIANQVNRGGLAAPADRLARASNEVMTAETLWGGHLAATASAASGGIVAVPAPYRRGKYLLAYSPLDGSDGIDVNQSAGTIFSVLRTPRPGADPRIEDFLQPGTEQVCAGFALYGPATMLILTTGDGVDGFTLDRDIGAFVLTHPRMRVPEQTREFAINSANERFWEAPVRRYIGECLAGRSGPREQDFTMHWVASLVADAFRILTRGGVVLYPADSNPGRPGRLRLMHACNPIAFLVEQAGGRAGTGRGRTMELAPARLDQAAPLVFGSRAEVERIERYHGEPGDESFDGSLFNVRSMFRAG